MIEFKVTIIACLLIIFTSVFFIHFAFNNFIQMIEICNFAVVDSCVPANLLLLFAFSFIFITSFIIVIETTIYFMFKWVELEMKMGKKEKSDTKSNFKACEIQKNEILKAKKNAQKKFFNRKISEKTFDSLKHKYDSELMENERETNKLKKKNNDW